MAKKAKVALPVAPLPDLIAWWKSQNTRGLIIGALAVSLLSRPRVTRDLDALALVPEGSWERFLKAGKRFGFVPRVDDVLEFAHEARVLLLRHVATGIDVDIALGWLPFEEEAVARAVHSPVGAVIIPLPTPEDLIIMKAVAHRDQDLLDIDGLLAAHPDVDVSRIRRLVGAFAVELESPEILDDLEKRLVGQAKTRRGKRKR